MMTLDSSKAFLKKLDVGEPPPRTRSGAGLRRGAPTIDFAEDEAQALVIGSQLTEFAAGIPAEHREQISNSLLLAQLAANKALEKSPVKDEAVWHETYRKTILNTGWILNGSTNAVQEISKKGMQVHKAIIPVITALLGPAVAAASVVVTALQGLAEINEGNPWITLFDQKSKRAVAKGFQFGFVEPGAGGAPVVKLMFFRLNAAAEVTQILFFKLSGVKGSLTYSEERLELNTSIYPGIADAVKTKVAGFIGDYIEDIDI